MTPANALKGGFDNAPVDAAHAFRAAMSAMACPGRIETLTAVVPPAPLSRAAGTLILTLCDPDTQVFLAGDVDRQEVRDWITFHAGARLGSAQGADFAVGTWEHLQPIDRFAIGTSEYPDRSTTLIVEVDVLEAAGARLTGPGIQNQAFLSLPDVGAFQSNHVLYPLGWDAFLTCRDRVAAVPRSTEVG